MPRPIRKTLSAAGSTTPIPVDLYPYTAISVAVILAASSTLTYTVEHTYDDVFAQGFDPATATWFPNADLAGDTANGESRYLSPVTAIRLRISSYSSGSATIVVLQTGPEL
jgi:hypothetical protein